MKFIGLLASLGLASLMVACSASLPTASNAAAAAPPVAADPAAKPAKPSDESVAIAFDPGASKLSPEADRQLDGAARLYRDARPEVMIVSGHTDKTGSEFGNLILSARRAEAVKQGLVDRGVPADRLEVVAIGEAEPVPAVPASRSAVITWR
jgi:outer membrane protein OmpA-like peptidoglycan-associated protein